MPVDRSRHCIVHGARQRGGRRRAPVPLVAVTACEGGDDAPAALQAAPTTTAEECSQGRPAAGGGRRVGQKLASRWHRDQRSCGRGDRGGQRSRVTRRWTEGLWLPVVEVDVAACPE